MPRWCGAARARGQVTASFELAPDHPVLRLLADNGLRPTGCLILRRLQSADGRTRAFINDVAVGVQLLREVGQALVEIHGQHDDRALIDPSGHRDLVDAFGGLARRGKRGRVSLAGLEIGRGGEGAARKRDRRHPRQCRLYQSCPR